jgi:hypothetical protein
LVFVILQESEYLMLHSRAIRIKEQGTENMLFRWCVGNFGRERTFWRLATNFAPRFAARSRVIFLLSLEDGLLCHTYQPALVGLLPQAVENQIDPKNAL